MFFLYDIMSLWRNFGQLFTMFTSLKCLHNNSATTASDFSVFQPLCCRFALETQKHFFSDVKVIFDSWKQKSGPSDQVNICVKHDQIP